MFRLQSMPIDAAACRAEAARAAAGACAIFEGWIRDHHRGREVQGLEFEAYGAMVQAEGERMVAEIEQAYPEVRVLCLHRTGRLDVGDLAVWIGATAPHRGAAFAACRETIEELKRRLPIWKKEHFASGTAEWVDCTEEQNPARRRTEYFTRLEGVREVGAEGLARLAVARVLVIGAGGLGCAALEALAGSGVGGITVVDDGAVERSNLPRQSLYTEADLGLPKAATAAARLRLRNPHLEVRAVFGRFTGTGTGPQVDGFAAVLDCTDNVGTRRAAALACARAGVPLVQAGVHGLEGTIDTFVPPDAGAYLWPDRMQTGVAETPVFTPAAAVVGQLQAAEAVKLILGLPVPSRERTLLVDLLGTSLTSIARVFPTHAG